MQHPTVLRIRSAGAAQGLIQALRPAFTSAQSVTLSAEYANVGATFEQVVRETDSGIGACALAVLTPPFLARLQEAFGTRVRAAGSLGFAATGLVSAEDGHAYPIESSAVLRQTLESLDALLAPDMENSTGGRQLRHVLEGLGVRESLAPRIRAFAGGAAAVGALAEYQGSGARVLACAQGTEVAQAGGVRFLGGFPGAYALATEYVVAVIDGPAAGAAHEFAQAMTGASALAVRRACGFSSEPAEGR